MTQEAIEQGRRIEQFNADNFDWKRMEAHRLTFEDLKRGMTAVGRNPKECVPVEAIQPPRVKINCDISQFKKMMEEHEERMKNMKQETLQKKAQRVNGKRRVCANCKPRVNNALTTQICDVCNREFTEGFIKGYKTHQQEQRDDMKEFIYDILRCGNSCLLLERIGKIELPKDAAEHTKAVAHFIYEALRDNKWKFD